MVRFSLLFLGLLCAQSLHSAVAQDDSIRKALDNASEAFDKKCEEVRRSVTKSLDERVSQARKNGNLDLIEQIDAEKVAMETTNTLPDSVPMSVIKKYMNSRTSMLSAYEKAKKGYLQKNMDAEAAEIEQEMTTFYETSFKLHPPIADLIGSEWTGTTSGVDNGTKWGPTKVSGVITSHEGATFTLRVTVGNTRGLVYEYQCAADGLLYRIAECERIQGDSGIGEGPGPVLISNSEVVLQSQSLNVEFNRPKGTGKQSAVYRLERAK